MKIPTKKLKSGFEIPTYGYGMGGKHSTTHAQDIKEISYLSSLIDMGISHFDTAELYADGHAEELLGHAISGHTRNNLFITSKIISQHLDYDKVFYAAEASLRRLRTDYIDLYLLHRYPEVGTDIRDTMRAMDSLIRQGVIKYIGVSNFSNKRLVEAQRYTENKIVCNQVHYSVKVREIEHRNVLDYCQKDDVMITAWGPLHGIDLSTPLIRNIAEKYNKSSVQIALNWLISQNNIVTICRSDRIEHLRENLGAVGWELDQNDVELIRLQFPDQIMISDRVSLNHPGGLPD